MMQQKAFNFFPANQMNIYDFINILARFVVVPNPFGINDHHRALRATIQAAGGIDPHPPIVFQPQRANAGLHVLAQVMAALARAAPLGAVRRTLIGATKDMTRKKEFRLGFH